MTCRLNSGLHVYLYTHMNPPDPSQTYTHKKNEKKLASETESRWGSSSLRLITQGQTAVGETFWGPITLSILAETHSLTHTHDKAQATDPGSVSALERELPVMPLASLLFIPSPETACCPFKPYWIRWKQKSELYSSETDIASSQFAIRDLLVWLFH